VDDLDLSQIEHDTSFSEENGPGSDHEDSQFTDDGVLAHLTLPFV